MIGYDALLTMIAESVGDQRSERDLKELAGRLEIDESNLNGEMADQSSLYAFAAVGAEHWDAKADVVRFERKAFAASLDKQIRSRPVPPGKKAHTETAIMGEITLDRKHKEIRDEELEYRATARIFKALAFALRDRATMLVSIGANRRSELDAGDLKINEATAKHKVRDSAGAAPKKPRPRRAEKPEAEATPEQKSKAQEPAASRKAPPRRNSRGRG